MRVKMLIASDDVMYTSLISEYISEHNSGMLEISVCNTSESLHDTLTGHKFDVALIEQTLIKSVDLRSVQLPLILWSEHETYEIQEELPKVSKYRRISTIIADVLEQYSRVSGSRHGISPETANITAVWSPAGGVGKTTVALVYAASGVQKGKEVFYLNLESFSSVPAFLNGSGKSISTVFEMLGNNEGNVNMLIQGIHCQTNGITYLCGPDNYDDINILTAENTRELVTSCAEITDELIIDLSCVCDTRTRQIFDLADRVLLVTDPSVPANTKISQFISQNNVFESIREKITLVANKGAVLSDQLSEATVSLPWLQAADISAICKTLKDSNFGM